MVKAMVWTIPSKSHQIARRQIFALRSSDALVSGKQWQLRLRKAWLCGGISEFSLETSCKALMVEIDG